MEHLVDCVFYNADKQSLGNIQDQSGQAAYEYEWLPNPDSGNLYSPHAPLGPQADGGDYYYIPPLLDPGSLGLVDLDTFQPPNLNEVPDNKHFNLNPNHLSSSETRTPYDGCNLLADTTSSRNTIASNGSHSSNLISPRQDHSLWHNKLPFMPPSPSSRDDHSLEWLENTLTDIVSVYGRTSHEAVPSVTGKRSRDAPRSHLAGSNKHPPRSKKIARGNTHLQISESRQHQPDPASHTRITTNVRNFQSPQIANNFNLPRADTGDLTKKQKLFVRQWIENFVDRESRSFPANEEVNALATLIHSSPQIILEYIHNKFALTRTSSATSGYSFKEKNRHLGASLDAVERYVIACHRRRAPNDGRRKINIGPYRCTYGCGYRTKRPFDWRRHEETHEPQELWLCHFCRQNEHQNPFLVNRKDKFLSHSKSAHKDWDPEQVSMMSKLDFHAKFDPKCPICPETTDSWNDRCKHIIRHFEDDIHGGTQGSTSQPKSVERAENTSDEEGSDLDTPSDSSESSDDEENDQGSPDSGTDGRDSTGGSNGGYTANGPSTHRGSSTGQGGRSTEKSTSYGSYSGMNFMAHFRHQYCSLLSGFEEVIKETCRGNRPSLKSSQQMLAYKIGHILFGTSKIAPISWLDSSLSFNDPSSLIGAPVEKQLSPGQNLASLDRALPGILVLMQSRSYMDLHRHPRFTKGIKRALRDPLAHYKARGKLIPWITPIRGQSTITVRRLWAIYKCMLQNRVDIRPLMHLLVKRVRKSLREGNTTTHPDCMLDSNISPLSLFLSSLLQENDPLRRPLYGNTARCGKTPLCDEELEDEAAPEEKEQPKDTGYESQLVSARYTSACVIKKNWSSVSFRPSNVPTPDIKFPDLVTDSFAFSIPPPAYHVSMLYPVSVPVPVPVPNSPNQPQALMQVAGITDNLGKVGMKQRHGTRLTAPPTALAQRLCYTCGSRFVAPRLDLVGCSHIRCERCSTFARDVPNSRPYSNLAGIGSHLLPPAYSFQHVPVAISAGDPLKETYAENTVLNLVNASNVNLDRSVEDRFIEELPSPFDRIHLRAQYPHSSLETSSPISTVSAVVSAVVNTRLQHEASDPKASISTSSTSPPSASPQSKRVKLDSHKRLRQDRRKNRQFISSRSKQTVRITQQQAMNDHNTTNQLDHRDINSRLDRIKKSESLPNNGDSVSRIQQAGTPGTSGTSSFDDSDNSVFAELPAFCKSKTSSTTGSNEVSRLEVMRSIPTPATNRESVEVEPGELSKPSIRRRRGTNDSSKSHKEFQYYGRHANSWLFNDFSISGHVRKGWVKVFSSKSEGDE